jgi:hypothetical protein
LPQTIAAVEQLIDDLVGCLGTTAFNADLKGNSPQVFVRKFRAVSGRHGY